MKFKKKILKNGLRIISAPLRGNKTVTVLALVEAGADYENKKNNGLSHFLEHLCFKGTKRRPQAVDISLELDKLGAHYNAFTGYELTGYYAKAYSKHQSKILDIISDLYLNPIFDAREIKKEKGVIIEEINMHADLPMRQIHDVLLKLLYGEQAAGRQISGPKKNVRKFVRNDFINYRKNRYTAKNTIIIIAGGFNEKKMLAEIREKFKNINTDRSPKKLKTAERQTKPRLTVKYKKSDQTHLILGARAFPILNKDALAASLLASVLGAGMSSRLFQKLRDEMGVCYYVSASNDTSTDRGFLGVSAGVNNERLEEVVQVLLEEFKKLKTDLVSEEELRKVKNCVIGNLYLNLESSDSIAEYFGIQELLKKEILTPQEKVEKIKAITAEDIKRVANKIFKNEKLNLAIIGPVKNKKTLQKILKL
ncbi:MAG: insulinase family protein [Candidatus Pacebacteria bacterium]|nr:insulinase family protein [Candidatus Paceibacterota bacterium]